MTKELLPPDNLTAQIKERREELRKVLEFKLKIQKNTPQGHLRIAQKGGNSPQFYHIIDPKDFNGKYISQQQSAFVKRLAQKDYDSKMIKLLQKQIRMFDKLLENGETTIGQLYSKMNKIRQNLITPITLTDEQYIEEWQNKSWEGHPFLDDSPEFTTALGERVRSKSEVIIADTLNRMSVPYKYEYPLKLKGSLTFHPDFLCLNVRTRKEFIWEHFGMMDSPEYLENAIQKLKLYSENDFIPGVNLITTMETQQSPLNIRLLEKLIKAHLL